MELESFREHFNCSDKFSVRSGMKLTELREGYAKVEMVIDDYSKNYMGSMHGGLLYTMADVAAGASMIYCGKQAVTLNASTEYIKAAYSGLIIAEGRVISEGKTICRCEVDVHAEDGTLYCKSHITMFVTDKNIVY